MKNNSLFLFDDKTTYMNASDRRYRFYEYTGLMKLAFGDEARFGENEDSFKGIAARQPYISNPSYNCKDYKPDKSGYRVIIRPGSYDVSKLDKIAKIMYFKIFRPTKFKEAISGIISLDYVKL